MAYEKTIKQYLDLINSGEGKDEDRLILCAAQKDFANSLEQKPRPARAIALEKEQLPLLNVRDFSHNTILAIGKYRILITNEPGYFRAEVYKPDCPRYGLANQPYSRLPRYIKEFVQL